MNREIYHCIRCGTAIDGNAQYCVLCYSELHQPCPNCMTRTAGGKYHVKKKGNPPCPVNCKTCHNERYILTEP